MPEIYTNTRAGLITIAWVSIEPGGQGQIPSDATIQKWRDESQAHKDNNAPDKGPAPKPPEVREKDLLAAVDASSVVKARHLVKGIVQLQEPVVNPGAMTVVSKKPDSLAAFDLMRATALVQLETSLEQLAAWSKVETRPEVMAKIKDRAERLAALK